MKNLYYLFFAVILICGCYDDKGNYDYKDLPEVEIELPEESYSKHFGEKLQITPVITTTIPENDLTYDWEFLTDTLNTWWDQYISVCQERVLDYMCELDGKIFPKEGTYNLRLNVTQVSSGRHFFSEVISVKLIAEASDLGLMVLHGDGRSSDIGIIVADEFLMSAPSTPVSVQVLPRYYSEANGGIRIDGKGRQILQTFVAYASSAPDNIVVIALTEGSSAVAYGKTMEKRDEWNGLFAGNLNKGEALACVIEKSNLYAFDGGDIFTRQAWNNTFTIPVFAVVDYEYNFYPWIWFPSSGSMQGLFFDQVSRGFIGLAQIHNFTGFSPINALEEGPVVGIPFNPANMQADLVYMEEGGLTGHMLAVMREDDGTYFLAELDPTAGSYAEVPRYKYVLDHLTDVQSGNVVDWAFGSAQINMCYYATSSGVYHFAADAGQAIDPKVLRMQNNDVVEFEGEITLMKILKPSINGGEYYMFNEEMVVGTYGGTSGSGILYSLELDPFSGRVVSVKKYTGFDEIYDVDIKGY